MGQMKNLQIDLLNEECHLENGEIIGEPVEWQPIFETQDDFIDFIIKE